MIITLHKNEVARISKVPFKLLSPQEKRAVAARVLRMRRNPSAIHTAMMIEMNNPNYQQFAILH